jgi:T-complex protein 1 subunit theta
MYVLDFSKWDVRRLCKAVGATPLPKMTPPTSEELGYADKVFMDELGDTSVVVFRMFDKVNIHLQFLKQFGEDKC